MDDLFVLLSPRYIKIIAKWNVRGGIYTTVEIEKFNNKTKENNANEPDLQTKIEYLWNNQTNLANEESQKLLGSVLELLDNGTVRVAEPQNGSWKVNDWLKKAVLMSFKISNNTHVRAGDLNFYDKVQSKFAGYILKILKT